MAKKKTSPGNTRKVGGKYPPPVETRWKPGQSGNPTGRPKNDVASLIAKRIFEGNEKVVEIAMLKAIKKGSPKVFEVLADRGYGKLSQKVEIPGIEGLADAIAQARKRVA